MRSRGTKSGKHGSRPSGSASYSKPRLTTFACPAIPSKALRSPWSTCARSRFQRQLRQRPAVGLNLANRFEDVVHVAAVGQEHVLGDGNGRLADLLVAFQLLEAVAVSLEPLGAPEPLEAARGDRLVEQAVVVLLAVHARTRHALRPRSPS